MAVKLGVFWKLVRFFGKPETPQKSLRGLRVFGSELELDALQVFGLFHSTPSGRNLAAGSIFM